MLRQSLNPELENARHILWVDQIAIKSNRKQPNIDGPLMNFRIVSRATRHRIRRMRFFHVQAAPTLRRTILFASVAVLCMGSLNASLATAANEPILRVNSTGATSFVTSLTFAPDGKTIYTGGFDKVIRVWKLNQSTGQFAAEPKATYRLPIGPGRFGQINCIAVSADGRWLAVGSDAVMRNASVFNRPGVILPRTGGLTPEMRLDQGRVFVFDTLTREVKTLRYHNGAVISASFLPGSDRYLVSAADEWDADASETIGRVRILDVVSGEEIASVDAPVIRSRPGLAPLNGADDPRRARIALAWGDGKLRVWDVASRRIIDVPDGTRDNNAIGYSSEIDRLITGTFRLEQRQPQNIVQGELNVWSVGTRGGRPLAVGAPLALPRHEGAYPFPRALGLLNQRDQTSVVLASRMTNPSRETAQVTGWELDLLDLDGDRLVMRRRVTISDLPTADRVPILATSSNGEWFALAGSGDQTIRVYRTADFRDGRANPFQRLVGNGRVMSEAYFVKSGDTTGIAMRSNRDGESWVLNIADRELIDGIGRDWSRFEAAADGYREDVASQFDNARTQQVTVTIRGPGLPVQGTTIRLPEEHQFAQSRTLPNFRGRQLPTETPLIAVVSTRYGLPRLAIYNGLTGETIRELNGHVERILSLSFSADGRFLVTTGNDQTVSVWSLEDLDQTLDLRGGVNGIAVDDREGSVVVVEVDSTAKVSGTLNAGDVITSIQRGNQTIEIPNVKNFFSTFWSSKPGTRLTLNRAGGAEPVVVTVEQGVDERKPLFSLYVEQTSDDADLFEWVGWSPLGPFDSSGGEIEKHLGWHFNGEETDDPVRFALLEEYPDLRRRGLLAGMIEEGKLPEKPVDPLPRPAMKLRIPDQPAALPKQQLVVSQIPESVELSILGLTPRQIQAATLYIDGELVGPLEFAGDQRWTAVTGLTEWSRGAHRISARVLTREIESQVFEQNLSLSYFLAAPQIVLTKGRNDWTDEEEYEVSALVSPKAAEPVTIELTRTVDNRREVVRTWEVTEPFEIKETVSLTEGMNRFSVSAININASDESQRQESRLIPFIVKYEPRRVVAPVDVGLFLDIRPVGEEGPVTPMIPNGVVSASLANPRFLISTPLNDNLPELELQFFDGAERISSVPLTFEEKDGKLLAFAPSELVEPRRFRIVVFDKTNDSALLESNLQLTAELPEVTVLSPTGGETLMKGRDESSVQVEAMLVRDEADHPFEAAILINGKEADVTVDVQSDKLVAEISLEPGENRIEILVSNEFDSQRTRPVSVFYRRPPRIEVLSGKLEDGPMATIVAIVDSELPLEQATIDGAKWPEEKLEVTGSASSWEIRFKEVPLVEGNNSFAVAVWNGEASVLEPSNVEIDYEPPAPPEPADVVVLSPRQAAVVDAPAFELEFEVTSNSRLLQVEVQLDDITIYRSPDVASIRANRDEVFVLREATLVELAAGPNHFKIITINEGGQRKVVDVPPITYQEPPVRLMIEGISAADGSGEMIRPRLTGDGSIVFDEPVDSDVVFIHAVADWRGLRDDFRNESTPTIQVLVNEFMQLSNASIDGEVSRFRMPVLLSKEDNQIRVVLPHYRGEASSQATFNLKCSNPSPSKRLHLLIVGIGSTKADSLQIEDKVLESLRAERLPSEKNFRTDTFENGLIYGPIVGSDLSQADILDQLITIQDTIRILRKRGDYHDVLMLYVEGGRLVPYRDEFVVTTRPADSPISLRIADDPTRFQDYSLSTGALRAMVQSTEGAKILMMDMLEGDTEKIENVNFDAESQAALMRFMWIKGEEETSPFPAFLDVISRGRRALRLTEWSEEFRDVANTNSGLTYQEWVSPDIVNLILVNQEREGVQD